MDFIDLGKEMGYRSDVAIALDKETYLKYEMLAGELPELLKNTKRREGTNSYFWFFYQTKWSGYLYECVKQVEEFLFMLEKEEGEETFAFLRIGEEVEDIETMGDPCEFELYVHCELSTPFGPVSEHLGED